MLAIFQSTHPLRGGTPSGGILMEVFIFQSTHPLRGGTMIGCFIGYFMGISIHPPLAGWDLRHCPSVSSWGYFNPPTPCGVGLLCNRLPLPNHNFNPPTPCGVGPKQAPPSFGRQNFNPPTPCGVGQQKYTKTFLYLKRNRQIGSHISEWPRLLAAAYVQK